MQLGELVDRLDEELRTGDYADLDASANGLQIGTRDREVEHVAFAVDAAAATIERAADAGADVLVTHHGLVWGGLDRLTGLNHERVAALVEGHLALYVSHLPLDGHQELGNAAGVADVLGLTDREPFGTLGPEHVGQRGRLAEPASPEGLAATLDDALQQKGHSTQVIDAGPAELRDVAVVTGSGVDWLEEAASIGADVLVTGEGKQQAHHEAHELGVAVLLAGHYATETFGVGALADLVDEWELGTTRITHPTGL